MQTKTLIAKLIEIGKASRSDDPVMRQLVVEAQDCALQMHREMLELLCENENLRHPGSRSTTLSKRRGKVA